MRICIKEVDGGGSVQLEVRLSVVLCGVFGCVEVMCKEEWMCALRRLNLLYIGCGVDGYVCVFGCVCGCSVHMGMAVVCLYINRNRYV